MWLYAGIIASIFCLLASAGLAVFSWGEAGPSVVFFSLLTLFWAKMLFTMLRQARNPEAESQSDYEVEPERGSETRPELGQKSEKRAGRYAEPAGSPTVFVPHWFLMGAILLTALLVCLAIIAPLLAK
ncbi:MAG TPA: hypothetical protein PLK28_08560 [Candidatus Rifleibacterium sp.]|nr:hypothetical protein [Candidatus Rifleibacterium sp.]